jgi:hypothetical protein
VVARYNENVDWTKQFTNVIIYNKGEELPDDFNQVMLDNVGREGHTYYKYIYDNYDNLHDYTAFLQGNPFDHSPNLIADLHQCLNNTDTDFGFNHLTQNVYDTKLSGCFHEGLPLIDTYEKLFDERENEMKLTFGAGAQFIVSKKIY